MATAASCSTTSAVSLLDPENSLGLLGSGSTNPLVRKFAVTKLRRAGDAELELYLLQLVQALRQEDFQVRKGRRYNNAVF